jgi:hypothetical protein
MLRNIIVCVAFVVGGLCFGVMYLAEYLEYANLREGKVVEGVVDAVGEEHVWFSYVDERGERNETVSSDVDEEVRAKLKEGDRVEVLRASAGTELVLALEPPSLGYLVTLGICILIGASFIFLPLLERRRLMRAGGDPIKVITVMLRKARFNALVVFICFGGMTYVFFGVGFLNWDPTSETGVGGYIIFGFLVAICGLIAVMNLRTLVGLINIQGSWIVKTIRDNPQEIAWIYESVARTQGVKMSGFSTVYIWFADGKNYIVQLGHTGAEEFIQALAARAPHAQIGYSKEVQQLYGENPASFRPGG